MAGKKYDLIFSNEEKEKIRKEYLDGASIRDICKKYEVFSKSWVNKIVKDIARNNSESSKLIHKKYPEKFLHSEEYKKKMRSVRLNYMKTHPEKTAWRKRNEPSYPEKCFIKFLIKNKYNEKYLIKREYPIFPFYIDFAFFPVKVAVEMDGSQHVKNFDRAKKDEEKNKVLLENGWKVLRISENLVKTDWEKLKESLDSVLISDLPILEKVGIFAPERPKHVERGEDGYSDKMRESYIRARKVKNRPSLEEIKKMLETNTMVSIGKMFGVSDTTVRKWIKRYNTAP